MLRFEHALRNDDDHTDERVEAPLADDQVPQHVRSCGPMSWLMIRPMIWLGLASLSLLVGGVHPAVAGRW